MTSNDTRRIYAIGFFVLGIILSGLALGYATRDLVEWVR